MITREELLWREIAALKRQLDSLTSRDARISDAHDRGSGTAFPTSPAPVTADYYFRTDLGWRCFYDGTRWLTCQEFTATMQGGTPAVWTAINANGNSIYSPPLRSDYAPFFTRHVTAVQVLTTNDGTNYWTITLKTTASNTIVSFNTSGIGPNTWNFYQAAINSAPAGATTTWIGWAKTSTPGDLLLTSTLYYRLIVT